MAFVNLPPNLKDIFYSITDRLAKLETQPDQAMYYAESAQDMALYSQSVANEAQVQAINAGVAANNAASQATIAQSQATIASTQATTAQTSADGKSKVWYSTSTPGSTANQAGDIWYQYGTSAPYVNKVIAQWSGAGGTTWNSVTVSGLIIANIDAGSITTGTLDAITINAGSGSQIFTVSSTGYLSAQGAYIKGNITADSGTFTGSIRADAGYFGTGSGATLTDGWSIGATGLTGVGTGTITGGAITGSTITGGVVQTSTGSSSVAMVGSQNALGFKSSGSYAGWVSSIGTAGIVLNYGSSPDVSGYPQSRLTSSAATLTGSAGSGFSANSTGTNNITGDTRAFAAMRIDGQLDQRNTIVYPGIATGSGSTMVVVTSSSRVAYTTSSERFKQDVEYINTTGWLDKVLAMKPITYKTDDDFVIEGEPNETQIGFLAEDINDIGGGLEKTVILDPLGDPFSLSYDRLTVFLTLAIKELTAKVEELEQKLATNS